MVWPPRRHSNRRSTQRLRKSRAAAAPGNRYMDATSTKAFGRLQTEITAIASLVRVLATSSSVADSSERTETGLAIPLFKDVLDYKGRHLAIVL
jgi:hypothetical protein